MQHVKFNIIDQLVKGQKKISRCTWT